MQLNTAAQNSQIGNAATDYATATLTIYTGAAPASANDAASGTLLVNHTLAGFGAASNGTITANAIADATIAAGGTAGYARITNGTETLQLTVSATGGGGEVQLSTTTLVQGGNSQVTSLTLSQPAG